MKRFFLSLFLLFFISLPALADKNEDVNYIVEQTVTRSLFEGALSAMRPVLISAMVNDLKQKNITINNSEAFFDIVVDEFIDEFTEIMQQETGKVYLELFSQEELAELAAFYKTTTGQKFIQLTPILMQEGANLGQIAGAKAGENAKGRVAKRLQEEGILIDNNKSLTQRLIDALK